MKLAIYGSGGFGREVAPIARQTLRRLRRGPEQPDIVFVSDVEEEVGSLVNSLRVISYPELVRDKRRVAISVADPAARRRLADKCVQDGLAFESLSADTHRRYDKIDLSEGAILSDYTILTGNARIGRHFHCNIYSYVAHDCIIGDFVTFAPKVCCNGRIVIEDDVYVGTGAMLKQGEPGRPLRIGAGAVVGMGSVVTKDVAPGTTVVGAPARPVLG